MENQDMLTKDQLTNQIDHEINQVKSDNVKPGWTTWAILAALGPLSWLLMLEITDNKFDLNRVLYVLLTIFFIFDILKFVRNRLRLLGASVLNSNLREENMMEVITRGSALLITAESCFAVFLCYYFRNVIPSYAVILGYVYISALILGYLMTLLARALGLPLSVLSNDAFPQTSKNRAAKNAKIAAAFVVFVIPLIITFALVSSFDYSRTTIFDIRTILLILGVLVLVHILLENMQRPKLLQDLINLRRDIIIDEVDIESASRDFKIIIKGMDSTQYIQKYTSSYLKTKREFENLLQKNKALHEEYLDRSRNGEDRGKLAEYESQMLNIIKQALSIMEKMKNPAELIWGLTMYKMTIEDIDISGLFSRVRSERLEATNAFNAIIRNWFETIREYLGIHRASEFIEEVNKINKKLKFDNESGRVKSELAVQRIFEEK